jgi:hypothetical protein
MRTSFFDRYAVSYYADEFGKCHRRGMHHMIMGRGNPLLRHLQIDHISRERLDHRRSNMRFATRSQNQANKGKQCNNTSGHKGVSWHKTKWEARIKFLLYDWPSAYLLQRLVNRVQVKGFRVKITTNPFGAADSIREYSRQVPGFVSAPWNSIGIAGC